jgi:(S)-mandelate dehydrogenase
MARLNSRKQRLPPAFHSVLRPSRITPIETIAKTGACLWFQLYLWHDRTLSDQLIERARAAGAETILLTVDTPVSPNREFNIRNGFGLPFKLSFRAGVDIARHPSWLLGVILPALIENKMPTFAHYPTGKRLAISRAPTSGPNRLADSLNWSDVERLRARWKGKLILKGILRVEDALKASALGVDGIVVSNHGGRALDGAIAPARVLQAIADAVGSRICVLADSGVRRGSDAVKLLALGARAVLVGRMPLFGTVWRGTDGAAHALATLHAETDRTMAMVGVRNVNEIGLSLLHRDGLSVC